MWNDYRNSKSLCCTSSTGTKEGRVILEPEAIIATKETRLHSRKLKEYLIRWNNFQDEDASWETEQFLQQYPSLPLL